MNFLLTIVLWCKRKVWHVRVAKFAKNLNWSHTNKPDRQKCFLFWKFQKVLNQSTIILQRKSLFCPQIWRGSPQSAQDIEMPFLLDSLLFCTTKQFLTLNISASKNVPFKLWQNQHNYQTHTLIKQFRLRVTFNSLFEKSQRQCQKVGLSMTDMFVIDHKEKLSLINHKLVCDKTRTIFLCYLLQTFLLL